MDEKDKLDVTDTFVPYDQHTSRTKMLQSLSTVLQEDAGDSQSVKERPGTARNPDLHTSHTTKSHHSLPELANDGIWSCERYVGQCTCVAVSRNSMFGR